MLPPSGPARLVFGTALFMAVVAFTIAAGLVWTDYTERRQTAGDWFERIQSETVAASESLSLNMRHLSDLAGELTAELESGELPVTQIEARLEEMTAQHADVFGLGVIFRPFAYAPDQRLYAPYMVKRSGMPQMVWIEDVYDYSQPEHDWYHQGIAQASWLEPFFGDASQSMITAYCSPFRLPEEQRVLDDVETDGTVCINYSLEDVWALVRALDLGETGYAFVITDQATFVSHPRREYVHQGLTLYEVADQLRDPVLRRLAQRATALHRGAVIHSNELTGQNSWIFYNPIVVPKWSLAVVAFTAEVPLAFSEHKRRQILIGVALVTGAVGLIVLLVAYHLGSTAVLWCGSAALALLFLVGVLHIWNVEFAEAGRDPPNTVMLVDRAGIESYLGSYVEEARLQQFSEPVQVPTGVFIQAIRFQAAHDFVITGFVWQRYQVPDHDDLQRGIFFPDAIPDRDIREELFRFREGDSEVIGWFFKTTVHQPYDYSRFPIDIKTLRLRVWHPDMARPIVLVPELNAYQLMHPTALPGMEPDFRLKGWQLQRSFFHRFHDYRSDLGIRGSARVGEFPELTYNITMLRNFTDAFISNQIPLFVAAIMLFAMLMIDTREKKRASLHGFTTSTVLATAAAILFIILLAHIDVRRRYIAEEVMYLEYFYFITYFAVVGLSINAFMLAALNDNRFFHYRDNLIPKLLFWPLLHGAFYVVTVYVFLW